MSVDLWKPGCGPTEVSNPTDVWETSVNGNYWVLVHRDSLGFTTVLVSIFVLPESPVGSAPNVGDEYKILVDLVKNLYDKTLGWQPLRLR